jgi:hypothetical protein
MRRVSSAVQLLLLLLIFNAATSPLWAQCAMCGESVAAGRKEGGGDLALGLNFGILFLLGTVFTLAGGLVGVMVYAARGAARVPEPAAASRAQLDVHG